MNSKTNLEAVIEAIQSGKFRECYFAYNRKSTDEARSQKNSIEYQKNENLRFAEKEDLKIADITIEGFCVKGVISERHSGFKEGDDFSVAEDGTIQFQIDRPKFSHLVWLINQGYVKGLVCLCWDRLSRNKSDDAIIRKLMKKGVDIRFVHAHYDDSSAGELHMDIDGMFAQHHSRVTSEKVRLSTYNSRRQGKCTYRAPIGYLNEGNMDYKPSDPERAPIVKELFELYVTGDWSLSDLTRYANKVGLTAPPMRRKRTKAEMLSDKDVKLEKVTSPIGKGYMASILKNKFYIGMVKGPDGEFVKSVSHEPLVSVKVFNQVQELLSKKRISIHYAEKINYPLRGVLRCAHCHRVYTPYEKKGILYFYSRCKDGCENETKNWKLADVADKVKGLINQLHFTEAELEEMDSRASTDIALLESKRDKEIGKLERQKKHIRDELAYLRTNRISLLKSGVYDLQSYVEEKERLEDEYDDLHQKEAVSEEAMRELIKEVVLLSELIKSVVPVYDFATPQEKEQIIKAIFSELYISHDVLQYKVKKEFEIFDKRFVNLCGSTRT